MTLTHTLEPHEWPVGYIHARQRRWIFTCSPNDAAFFERQLKKLVGDNHFELTSQYNTNTITYPSGYKQRLPWSHHSVLQMSIIYDKKIHDKVALCLGLTAALL